MPSNFLRGYAQLGSKKLIELDDDSSDVELLQLNFDDEDNVDQSDVESSSSEDE